MYKILTVVAVAALVGFSALAQSVKFAQAVDLTRLDQASICGDTSLFGRPGEAIEEAIINGKLVPIINGRVVAQDSGPNVCDFTEDETRIAGRQPNPSYDNTLGIDVASQ